MFEGTSYWFPHGCAISHPTKVSGSLQPHQHLIFPDFCLFVLIVVIVMCREVVTSERFTKLLGFVKNQDSGVYALMLLLNSLLLPPSPGLG